MADSPQDPPRHAGQVVRRVLLGRNITIDAETLEEQRDGEWRYLEFLQVTS
jgi:hypothetical protein